MRQVSIFAGFVVFVVVSGAVAGDPAPLVSPGQPMLLTASASACNGAITLHLRTVRIEPTVQEMILKTPVKEVSIVNGRVVETTKFVEERRQQTFLRPAPGSIIDIPYDGLDVLVADLKGKPVTPQNVTRLLKKETPVLVSVSGPVDPYYLQTTKPGTLIVQLPAQLMNPPTELHMPLKLDPNEPPIAPARPGSR